MNMVFYQEFIILVFISSCLSQTPVTLKTHVGSIMGFQEYISLDGEQKLISKFLGIPYAESTTGPNRFRKPVPKAPFQSTFDARNVPMACYQESKQEAEISTQRYGVPGYSEDCLTLNIYVPHGFSSNDMLPVMIWIYGGGFTQGAASMFNPEVLALFGNVIVVTINYRIGMFGFLRDSNGIFPGNQGLWDQHLAIKWVHDNIDMFYGYKDEITIFGESAGGASVLLQAIYPGNKGLFKRVIAESGTAISPWAIKDVSSFERYLTDKGCLPTMKSFVNCLQSKAPVALQSNNTIFGPVVDGEFLIDTPKEIIEGKTAKAAEASDFFGSLDILLGVNDKDGALYFQVFEQIVGNDFNITENVFKKRIVPFMANAALFPKDDDTRHILEDLLIFVYTNWKDPDNYVDNRDHFIEMATDAAFAAPALQTARAHAALQRRNTYFYEFAAMVENIIPLPTGVKGSNHANEVPYVLGLPFLKNASLYGSVVNNTAEEKQLSRATMAFWSNFAKSGNPNVPIDVAQYTNTSWPEFTMTSQRYFEISNQMSPNSVHERFHPRRMALWTDLIPNIETLRNDRQAQPEIVHFDPSVDLVG